MLREALTSSDQGLQAIVRLQAVCGLRSERDRSLVPYVFFKIASTFGEEIFSLMPLVFWYGFPNIALPFSTNFVGVILTGQYLKDVIRIPRPCVKTTKIIRLESNFETEYGMPSTHSTSGLMPFVILLALRRHQPLLHDSLPVWIYPFFTFMSVSVGVSRLYLGVHSIPDVVAGLLIGVVGVLALHAVGDSIDNFVYKSKVGIAVPLVALLWFSFLYPKSRPWSAAWGTAAQIFGTWFGVAVSCWLLFNEPLFDWIEKRLVHNAIRTQWDAKTLLCELGIAAGVAGAAKVGSKVVMQGLLMRLLERGFIKPHPEERKDTLGREVPLNKLYCIEIPTRVAGYAFLAFSVVILTPIAWSFFGV